MKSLLNRISYFYLKFFKKEKIDWLDEQPYIGKYFIYKIRRLIMGIIYKVWSKVEDHFLEKYYAEIGFKNQEETFQALMPFIIMAHTFDEAENVIGKISYALQDTLKFIVHRAIVDKQLLITGQYDKKIQEILTHLKNTPKEKKGTIKFDSRIGTKTKPNLPFENHNDFTENIKERNEILIDFPIIKNGTTKHPIYQVDEFFVIVKILKEE